MLFMTLLMLLICIGIPLAYAWRVVTLDEPTKAAWLLIVADATVFVTLVLLVGRWDMAGYFTRYSILMLFVASILWSATSHAARPWRDPNHRAVKTRWTTLASLVLFGGVLTYVVYGMLPASNAGELAFPLQGGRFMIAQGGNNSLLNHHSGHQKQQYAADITAIGPYGLRAAGLAPKELHHYEIYGASVVSPCDGVVFAIRDGLPDLIPPASDPENAAGNHVIVDCGNFHVELAHFQRASISVTTGSAVSVGDHLGKVGNSGNTTEPHLHVHAVDPKTERGIPMRFSGHAPLRNRLYVN